MIEVPDDTLARAERAEAELAKLRANFDLLVEGAHHETARIADEADRLRARVAVLERAPAGGRVLLSREEHADLLRRAGDAEERAARAEMELRRLLLVEALAEERLADARRLAEIEDRSAHALIDARRDLAAARIDYTAAAAARDVALRAHAEALDDLERIADALGMVDHTDCGRSKVATADEMVAAIGRMNDAVVDAGTCCGWNGHEGAHEKDCALGLALADLSEARAVVRSLLAADGAPRPAWADATHAAEAAVKRWDAPAAAAPLAAGDRVRVTKMPDSVVEVRVGDEGVIRAIDTECPEGPLYSVRFPEGDWWWFAAAEIERVPSEHASIADVVRAHVEADGEVTLHPSFARVGDEDLEDER